MKHQILVVEDDETLQRLLAYCLEKEGYKVSCAGSAKEAHAHLGSQDHDVVLLDLGLPDEDGLVLARQLRTRSEIPIIVLTGNQDQETLVSALQLGTSDYIRKPFDPRELTLRIRSVLTRSGVSPQSLTPHEPALISFDGWTLDLRARSLLAPDKSEVALTPGEFGLLSALLKRPGWALSRDQLLDAIANGDDPPSPRMIDVFISQLRGKIESDSRRPTLILSVRGYGYKFGGTISS
jgi:DNA-binding response OmpR family regulator